MRIAAVLLLVSLTPSSASAQAAADKPASQAAPAPQTPATPPPAGSSAGPSGAQAPPAAAPVEPLEPQGYTYNPEGRRDPFISLVRRGAEVAASTPGERPTGIPGMTAAEVALKGIVKTPKGWMAMLQGTDAKTYLVRAGDRLLDGTIRTITADTMVIVQKVNDPLSLQTTREVRKMLRETEEANK
jgi:Tfp pilus assembly protein PilP